MLYYSTNPNIKTVCSIRDKKRQICERIRAAKLKMRESYYEFIEANGGSPNGRIEYRYEHDTLDAAREAAQEKYWNEEAWCEDFPGSWHSERIYKVTVNGYGDEIQREEVPLFE